MGWLACNSFGCRVSPKRQNPSGHKEEIPHWEAKYCNGFLEGSCIVIKDTASGARLQFDLPDLPLPPLPYLKTEGDNEMYLFRL